MILHSGGGESDTFRARTGGCRKCRNPLARLGAHRVKFRAAMSLCLQEERRPGSYLMSGAVGQHEMPSPSGRMRSNR